RHRQDAQPQTHAGEPEQAGGNPKFPHGTHGCGVSLTACRDFGALPLPTCGERVGVRGAFQVLNLWRSPPPRPAPPARLSACASPSPRARGEVEPAATQALRHTQEERSYDSRRALEARERFVDLEAARLGFFALLALAFDYVLRRARDEVGIGELGVDAGDVGFNARHFLLEAR